MKFYNFAVIGCGLMGREFASATARWCHLTQMDAAPRIIAVCDTNSQNTKWFCDNFASIKQVESDYHKILENPEVDCVYCAVPHSLHEQLYSDIIRAGKNLLGEKPFGIDMAANEKILEAISQNPSSFVRCASEIPYFPACQELIRRVKSGWLGRVIEVRSAFCHSSDMDPQKPINWKRMIEINGEYGCMGDLGIHTQHVPFNLGYKPLSVYASLSNIITERPDGKGGIVPCQTWDNATLICESEDENGNVFPVHYITKRMSPGSTNEWYIEIDGTDRSVKFSTNEPNIFQYTEPWGKEQAWCKIDIGSKPLFPTITGGIFEFGFSDAILQMWAAYISELEGKDVAFKTFTPEQTRLSHKILTAALKSYNEKIVVKLD